MENVHTGRALTRFRTPLTRFHTPIISSIGNEFALSEKYVGFWYTNLQVTAESSHYLMWLKSLCSCAKACQSVRKHVRARYPRLT